MGVNSESSVKKRIVANCFGRCFKHAKETFKLEDLKPGDNIVKESLFTFHLKRLYWHHMVVESVDLNRNTIGVIHYYNWYPSVCHSSLKYTPDKFYRIVHDKNECFPPCEVLKNADKRIKEDEYNFLTNNCEHFANECTTGEKQCHQIQHLIWTSIGIFAKSAISSVAWFFKIARQHVDGVIKVAESAAKACGLSKITQYRLNSMAKSSTRLLIGVTSIVEVVLLSYDCHVAITKCKEGKITREELCEVIVKRICAAIFSILVNANGTKLGFQLGCYLGEKALPVIPVFWQFLCETVLPFLGSFLGCAVSDFLGKVAGGYLGDLLTPLFIYAIEQLGDKQKTA